MEAAIQNFITNPAYADYLGLLKGARNGLVYGAKVRFPHALVIAILFGRGECAKSYYYRLNRKLIVVLTAGRRGP